MTTYSLAITGLVPGQSTNKAYDIPDANIDGNASATVGGMQGTMATNDLMLVKGPDGAQHWYRYDAERSTVANPVLLRV